MKFTIFSTNSTPIFITEGVTADPNGGAGIPKTTYGLFKDQGISSEVLKLRCPELEQALKVIEFYAIADYSGCEFGLILKMRFLEVIYMNGKKIS